MIARHQTLPAPNTFIKLIHSALQDNGVAAGKVSIASQKSNPDSIGTEIIRAGSTMALALVSFVRTTFNRRATRGEWGRRLPGRRPPANSAADECIWSEIYGAHTEAGTERWVDQCTY